MTKPTPNQVTDYKSPTDPRRMALLRDSIVDRYLTVATEDEARDLIAQLTAWLDAPRLAARETAEVVARDAGDTDGPDSPHECPKCCGWTVYEADDATGGGQ